MNKLVWIALAILFSLTVPSNAADRSFGQPYVLGPQDRVRIKVLEWLPSKGDYREWQALSGEYTIANSGVLMLPLIGRAAAEGKSTSKLADELAEGLRSRTGLVTAPDVSVEVIAFRPVFVLGDVEKPGEFSFRPRLTVLQAVGLAGGRYRPVERLRDSGRDLLRQIGALEGYRYAVARAKARLARLATEAANKNEIVFPADLSKTAHGATAIEQEQAVFKARAVALEEQLKALKDLETLFASEANILESKSKTHERQVSLLEEELSGIRKLVEKKLAPATRERALERSLSELEGRRLDLTTSIMRARQKSSEAVRDALALRNNHSTQVAQSLLDTRAELEQIQAKSRLARNLALEIGMSDAADSDKDTATPVVRYTIVRQGKAGDTERVIADEDTLIQPGDTLKVELQLLGTEPSADPRASSLDIPMVPYPSETTDGQVLAEGETQ